MNANKSYLAGLTLVFILVASLAGAAQGQTRKELEKKRKKLETQIKITKKVLKETQEKQNQSLQTLEALSRQIRQREKLIGTVSSEITEISGEISTKQQLIDRLSAELDTLKKDYARMLVRAYKARNGYNKVSYLFASSSFNQAVKRIKYMQHFGEARKRQLEKIARTKSDINNNLVDLQKIRIEKEVLVSSQEEEKKELEKDKSSENTVLKSLKAKEKDLKEELKQKQDDAAKLNKAIENLIAKEIEAARKKREEEARKKAAAAKKKPGESAKETAKSREVVASPEEVQLSADFEKNKNRLPWPLEKGFVTSGFGIHRHPEMQNITIVNNGIDISTSQGMVARSVFKGKVVAIINVAGSNTTVLVSHGEYYTVYSNLDNVFVSKGQEINIRQKIGTVHTDEEGKTSFHFELWKKYTKLDPEEWLYDK